MRDPLSMGQPGSDEREATSPVQIPWGSTPTRLTVTPAKTSPEAKACPHSLRSREKVRVQAESAPQLASKLRLNGGHFSPRDQTIQAAARTRAPSQHLGHRQAHPGDGQALPLWGGAMQHIPNKPVVSSLVPPL